MHKLPPPPVEWTFATPAITSGYGPQADWLYSVIQTSDNAVLTAGFAADDSGNRKPILVKYDPFKRTVIWENVMLPGNQTFLIPGGVLFDVFEFDDGGGNAYYAVGSRATTTSSNRLVVAKVHPENGAFFPGYPKIIQLNMTDTIASRGYAIAPLFNDDALEGYMIAGYIFTNGDNERGALIKLDENGDLDAGFGTGGYMAYTFTGYGESRFRNFTPVYDADTIAGYAITGWAIDSLDEDILVVRTDSEGNEVWHNVITQTDLNNAGYDDGSLPAVRCEPPTHDANRGRDIGIGPDGDFIVSSEIEYYHWGNNGSVTAHCDEIWPGSYSEYTHAKATLLKVDADTGNVEWANFVRRFTGLDFEVALEIAGSTAFICGSANDNEATLDVEGIVIAYDLSSPAIIWEKKFSVRDDTAQTNCIFDLALTNDGGIVVCGNNEISGDDFILAKLRTNCQLEETFDITDGVTISGDSTWSANKKVKGTVRIISGGHLTINSGAVISFANTYATNDIQDIADGEADYTKIIVEEGGKLTLDDCTLKGLNACEENWMWEGIEVWGTPQQIQNTSSSIYQGHVHLQNGAVIENAIIGILADKKRYNANGNWYAFLKDAGGIVRSDEAVFLNCRRSVHFSPYSVKGTSGGVVHFIPNKSYFDDTDFTNDDFMADPFYHSVEHNSRMGVNTHASMWATRGINFTNCTFSSFTDLPVPLRGIGIASDDAGYQVLDDAPVSNFFDLYRGIVARSAFDQLSSITVKKNMFSNVYYGIHGLNGTTHTIEDNEFVLIPDSYEPDDPAKSYGVRFDGTSAYKISGNTFEAADVGASTLGVIVDNTGALPSEISGNTFKLRIGNQTQNNNSGLQIRCNTYQSNTYAWAINPESDTNGFLTDQGKCGTVELQAGNIFTTLDCPGGDDDSHIFSTIAFEYRYRPTGNEIPTCVSMVVDTQNCLTDINITTCPTELPCHPCFKDDLITLVEEADSADERKRYLIELLRYLVVTDSIGEAAEIIVEEAVTDSVGFSKLAVKALISAGEYEDAETELGKLPLTDTTFQDLYGMLLTIALEDTLTLLDIKPEDETMLEDISHGNSEEKLLAQAVLEIARGRVFERYTEVIGGSSLARAPGGDTKPEASPVEQLQIVPNPSTGAFTIRYPILSDQETGQLVIRDMTGRVLMDFALEAGTTEQQIASNLTPGMYQCAIYRNGKFSLAGKIVLTR